MSSITHSHSSTHSDPTITFDLSHQAHLIPHWLPAATDASRFFYGNRQEAEAKEFSDRIQQCAPNALQLKSVAQDAGQPLEVRACAAMMFLLHPQGDKYLQPWQSLLVEASRPEVNAWYLRAVVICLRLVASEEDRAARLIVGGLLERTRGHFEHTQQIQRLLSIWREASHAPVTRASVQETWLAGD